MQYSIDGHRLRTIPDLAGRFFLTALLLHMYYIFVLSLSNAVWSGHR